jgi:CubicO group peptidase (beta-lactamase class C family)
MRSRYNPPRTATAAIIQSPKQKIFNRMLELTIMRNVFAPTSRAFSIAGNGTGWIGIFLFCAGFMTAQADDVDDLIATRMRKRHITGLSVAIIEDGRIIKEKGYGFMDKSGKAPVTPATLFQAASISKSVAALAALHLVQEGRLSLDADVNTRLHTWKVPENEFTENKKVTLRGILSHSAGLTVDAFPGYVVGCPVPTLLQLLDGIEPANTPAIRVDIVPGSEWRYSGGGYAVMQQMIIDATGKPFPEVMRHTVLEPLGMMSSTYDQPLPERMAASAATGYYANGKAVEGRWHVYPEMAAAGLWTTASDLARFAIGVQRALAGDSNPVLSQSMTHLMLTHQADDDGLGVFLEGSGKTLRFFHEGRNKGFDARLLAYTSEGRGAVILINTNDDSGAVEEIVNAIAKKYHWP